MVSRTRDIGLSRVVPRAHDDREPCAPPARLHRSSTTMRKYARLENKPEASSMAMKRTLEVINRMEADGVIGRHAIAGAVAAYNYVESSATEDLDILVSFDAVPGRPQAG